MWADHSGRAVWSMNCLHPLEHWDRGVETEKKNGQDPTKGYRVIIEQNNLYVCNPKDYGFNYVTKTMGDSSFEDINHWS
jgi:hypothetical protein